MYWMSTLDVNLHIGYSGWKQLRQPESESRQVVKKTMVQNWVRLLN